MEIKLLNVKDIDGLFKVIGSCEDKVELVGDDIRLNMKSRLSQYFSLAKVFSDGQVSELNLVTHNINDSKKIIDFLIYEFVEK